MTEDLNIKNYFFVVDLNKCFFLRNIFVLAKHSTHLCLVMNMFSAVSFNKFFFC